MGKKKAFLLRNPAAYLKSQRNTYQDFGEDLLSTTCILCKTTSFRKQSSPACWEPTALTIMLRKDMFFLSSLFKYFTAVILQITVNVQIPEFKN